jgi:hypothetical protein
VVAEYEISDYQPTSGKMRAYFNEQDGKQRGDPQRAAAAIVKAVESEHPPLRLLLGASTIPRLKSKLDAWQKEVDLWRETTLGADFPEGM